MSMTEMRALCLGICGVLLCATELLPGGTLYAQRVAPAGIRRVSNASEAERITASLRFAVRQSASDSSGADRMEHAVVGAAVGAVVGVAVGYHRGKRADAQCTDVCAGPAIATLVLPPFYGLVGAAVGGIVGYVVP